MKRDKPGATTTEKQILDQHTQALSDKHHRRLEQMTARAISHYANKQRKTWQRFTLPLAMASSIMVALWMGWALWQPAGEHNDPSIATIAPADTAVPEWVTDTSVPLSLLDNMAFYDWLAKQVDKPDHG